MAFICIFEPFKKRPDKFFILNLEHKVIAIYEPLNMNACCMVPLLELVVRYALDEGYGLSQLWAARLLANPSEVLELKHGFLHLLLCCLWVQL